MSEQVYELDREWRSALTEPNGERMVHGFVSRRDAVAWGERAVELFGGSVVTYRNDAFGVEYDNEFPLRSDLLLEGLFGKDEL